MLRFSQFITESTEEHHTSVIPLVGFSPISHMGHKQDLGQALGKLPGTKHVGISGTGGEDTGFSNEERVAITKKQWGPEHKDTTMAVGGAGETIKRGYDSLPKTGKKVLHLLVGHDRRSFAEGLKKSLEAGKIKSMEGQKFDEIHIHHPEDTDRSHGMSGTSMRAAANQGNADEFHKHLGPMFSKKESGSIMGKMKQGIDSGKVKLKR